MIEKRKKDLQKFDEIMGFLGSEVKLPEKYRDHKLSGEFQGCRECHIEPDWLLVYRVMENVIIFERTGTHSDLFKK